MDRSQRQLTRRQLCSFLTSTALVGCGRKMAADPPPAAAGLPFVQPTNEGDLQDALTAGGNILLPRGKMTITRTLEMQGNVRTRLVGSDVSVLFWNGPPNAPLLRVQGCRECLFDNFEIAADMPAPLQSAMQFETAAGHVATANVIRQVVIQGFTPGAITYGFRFVAGTGGDANNDVHSFYDCRASNCGVAAWSFEHAQSLCHVLRSCKFTGGQFGVSLLKGSFTWDGMGGGATQAPSGQTASADFYLASPSHPILINDFDSERSARFLVTGGPTAAAMPISVRNLCFSGGDMASDGRFIWLRHPGPLLVDGGLVGVAFDPHGGAPPHIYSDCMSPGYIDVRGVTWETNPCQQAMVLTTKTGSAMTGRVWGCTYRDPHGQCGTHIGPEIGEE